MSQSEKGVIVRILDKEFRIACSQKAEPALRDAAHFLDKHMRKIRQSGRVIGIERIAVMAALNISHELLSVQKGDPQAVERFSDRLRVLQEKIDGALSPSDTESKEAAQAHAVPLELDPVDPEENVDKRLLTE